jgi:beta-carotene 15,15'-dioxygenase
MKTVDDVQLRVEWFAHIHSRLTWGWIFGALLLAAGFGVGLFQAPSLTTQLWILAIGVGIFGVPHGALDHELGRAVFGRTQKPWVSAFLCFYLGVAFAVLALWWFVPVIALIAFLVVSAIHFGMIPGLITPQPSVRLKITALLIGSLIASATILLPWLIFPDDVTLLFSWLTQTKPEYWQPYVVTTQSVLIAFVGLIVIARLLVLTHVQAPPNAPIFRWCCEALATGLLFVTCPPLLAFTFYFAFLHSPRHILELAATLRNTNGAQSVGNILIHALPLTIVTILFGVGAFFWLRAIGDSGSHVSSQVSMEQAAVVRVIFCGLAALTFPHMLITWRWHQLQR